MKTFWKKKSELIIMNNFIDKRLFQNCSIFIICKLHVINKNNKKIINIFHLMHFSQCVIKKYTNFRKNVKIVYHELFIQ